MIDKIFVAPRPRADLDGALDFARQHGLNYQCPCLLDPEALASSESRLKTWEESFATIEGWKAMFGPSPQINPLVDDPEISLLALRRYTQSLDAAKSLKARYILFPSLFQPLLKALDSSDAWIARYAEFWKKLAEEQLRGSDVTVLIRNFQEREPGQLADLLTRIEHPRVKLALDIGAVNVFSDISPIDWLDTLVHHVEYICLADNDGVQLTYGPLGEGSMDMDGFLNHMTLLPQRFHVAMEVDDHNHLTADWEMLKPFLKLQQEHLNTKSLII